MLASTDIQDQLAICYLTALGTAAGYTCAIENIDRHAIDLIMKGGKWGFPQIDWQVKATFNLAEERDGVPLSFELKKRNYDALIDPNGNPRLLMVYRMPTPREEWLISDDSCLQLRTCAYWTSLKGMAASDNTATKTIRLDANQKLSVDTVRALMASAEAGTL